MNKLILASASPRRKEIMELMGLNFTVCPSQCEELITETDPSLVVMELSRQKALDVAAGANEDDVIIGSDTVVALNGEILGKPKNRTHGFAMLKSMSGKTHHVYTGVTIVKGSKMDTFAECTEVHITELSDDEINGYLDKDEYKDKAGAYAIQGGFAPYVTGINGDYYNVMGLPAAALYQHLKAFR